MNEALNAVHRELENKLGKPLKVSIHGTPESQVVAGVVFPLCFYPVSHRCFFHFTFFFAILSSTSTGTNYRFEVLVEDSAFNTKTYAAQVWSKLPAHGGSYDVTKLEQLAPEPGSPRKIFPTPNSEVEDAAAYAVQKLGEASNSLFPFQLTDVKEASQTRNSDGSVTHNMRLLVRQGSMPDEQYDVS